MTGEPPVDVIPGKMSIWPSLIFAFVIVGATAFTFAWLGFGFSFWTELFVVALAIGIFIPAILKRIGALTGKKLYKYVIVALIEAVLIATITGAWLIAEGIWMSPSGGYGWATFFSQASITMFVVAWLISFLQLKYDIVL